MKVRSGQDWIDPKDIYVYDGKEWVPPKSAKYWDGNQWVDFYPKGDDPTGSPGPINLIGGDMDAGFFGEVPTDELITGVDLAGELGLTAGTPHNEEEPWFKFSYKNRIQFIPKRTLRYDLSHDDLSALNLVDGSTELEIKGVKFKVRLIMGASSVATGNNGAFCHHSEWNKLMLPIHENAPSKWESQPQNVDSPTDDWGIGYTDSDLGVGSGDGHRIWCRDDTSKHGQAFTRGLHSVEGSYMVSERTTSPYYGWLPVLEVV